MTPSILDDVMFCADTVPAIVSTRARMTPIEREIMEVSLLFSLALGPHPQRDLSLTPRLGFTGPRLGVAAGAFSLALGPPNASFRLHLASDLHVLGSVWPQALFHC